MVSAICHDPSLLDVLIRDAQSGVPEARDALVPQYRREIQAAVARFLAARRQGDREDVAQDVWTKVFDRLDRFDPDRGVKFSTWLYTLARNHCFDVEKRRRLPLRSLDGSFDRDADAAPFELRDDAAPSPSLGVERGEFADAYRHALASLDPRQAEVFEARVLEGLEFHEVAKRCRIPLGTAKSHYYRAVEKLRGRLSAHGADLPRAA
jgi:RNA polymerase sigma-70 factor (ECF subfamily)